MKKLIEKMAVVEGKTPARDLDNKKVLAILKKTNGLMRKAVTDFAEIALHAIDDDVRKFFLNENGKLTSILDNIERKTRGIK
jgi:hypothetical protein